MSDSLPPLFAVPQTPSELIRFQARHKLLLMAHAPKNVSALGRLVGRAGSGDWSTLINQYHELLQQTLALPRTRGKHVNVLQHMAGYVRDALSEEERGALIAAIDAYARGQAPLDRPRDLIRRHAEQQRVTYLLEQVYFSVPE